MEIKEITIVHNGREVKMFDFIYHAMIINCKGEKRK